MFYFTCCVDFTALQSPELTGRCTYPALSPHPILKGKNADILSTPTAIPHLSLLSTCNSLTCDCVIGGCQRGQCVQIPQEDGPVQSWRHPHPQIHSCWHPLYTHPNTIPQSSKHPQLAYLWLCYWRPSEQSVCLHPTGKWPCPVQLMPPAHGPLHTLKLLRNPATVPQHIHCYLYNLFRNWKVTIYTAKHLQHSIIHVQLLYGFIRILDLFDCG